MTRTDFIIALIDDELAQTAPRRFARSDSDVSSDFGADAADTIPDGTSIYDLTPTPVPARYVGSTSARRRRQIRETRENVLRLREAIAEGWDVRPELAHEQRRLAELEAAEQR